MKVGDYVALVKQALERQGILYILKEDVVRYILYVTHRALQLVNKYADVILADTTH